MIFELVEFSCCFLSAALWCTGIDRFLISRVRNLDKNLAVRLCITVNIRTARLALVRSTVRNRIIPSDRGACIACPTVVLTSLNKWAEINVIWLQTCSPEERNIKYQL